MSKNTSGGITISQSVIQKFLSRRINQNRITFGFHLQVTVKMKILFSKVNIDYPRFFIFYAYIKKTYVILQKIRVTILSNADCRRVFRGIFQLIT